jgi:hypothetical protein
LLTNRYGHVSPRYIWNRTNEYLYRRRNPGLPWLTPQAIEFIQGWLLPDHCGLEFGSGRSTIWFAGRSRFLTSVEHDPAWFSRVSEQIRQQKLENVNYLLRPVVQEGDSEYAAVARHFSDCTLDYILVDGVERSACALRSLSPLRAGGILIIDNANWVLPCATHSPASIGETGAASTPEWESFRQQVAKWHCLWTSNGVTDTAIYFKPPYESGVP